MGVAGKGADLRRPDDARRRDLDAERDATVARVADLHAEVTGIVESCVDAGTDDEHDPEGATVAFERQRAADLLGTARRHLAELDAARHRLSAGSYGTCELCGGRIADERLEALPAATRCVACATTLG